MGAGSDLKDKIKRDTGITVYKITDYEVEDANKLYDLLTDETNQIKSWLLSISQNGRETIPFDIAVNLASDKQVLNYLTSMVQSKHISISNNTDLKLIRDIIVSSRPDYFTCLLLVARNNDLDALYNMVVMDIQASGYREDRASRYYDSIIAVANGNNGMISHDQLRWLSNQSQSFQSMMNSIAGAQSNSINQEGLKKLHDDPSKDSFYNDVDVLSIFNKRGVVGLSHANSLYDTAIALYEKEIKLGNATAMCNRAYMHQHGLGGSKDCATAIALYEKAIKLGNATAMRNRAYMHEHGLGGSKDYATAIALYEKAIKLGNATAMNNRAYMHQHGLGGSKDYAAAIALYEKAIELGDATAMCNRAYMHEQGLGGSKDYAAAIALYEKAIKLGNATAMSGRAYMHQHGLGGSKDYAAAIVLYEQAIKLGNAYAMRNRAYMHQHGLGGSKDYAAAIVLYELAIKLGNASAMRNRAYMHEHGLGGSKDYAAAIALYEKAIKLGNATAIRNRAYMHQHGLGGSKDYAAAIVLYEKAIELGNACAMRNRAYMHQHGLGGSKDYATAIALYEKAIKLGNATAMNDRAYMHQHGLGGSKDYAAAIVLYEQAIKLGNATAMRNRAYMHQHGLGGSKDYVAAIVLYDRAVVSFSNFLDREISDLLSTGSQFFTPNNLINALLPRLKTGETVSTSIYQWLIRHKKELLKQILVGEDDDTAKYKVIHSALTDQDHVLYKIFYKKTGFTPVSVDKPKSNLGQLRIKHDELATNLNLPVYDAGKFMSNSSASFFTNASTAKVDTCCEPRDAVDDCEGYGSVFNSITDAGL